jgi:shikimate dehydrogenase
LVIASRRPVSAQDRLGDILSWFDVHQITTAHNAAEQLHTFDLVVQATPVGSASYPGYPLDPPLNFKRNALVMDLLYTPRRTHFLDAAAAFGARTENGLVMLTAQAAASFERWTGLPFPLEQCERELLPELQSK